MTLTALTRFVLITQNAPRLAQFFERGLGFQRGASRSLSASDIAGIGIEGNADCTTLRLGGSTIDLLQCVSPGRPYPVASSASDLLFQHFAIVVTDIKQAYHRLLDHQDWCAISTEGPQVLPPSSGGVSAFKFRDSDGHPLELLEFPTDRTPPHWRDRPPRQVGLGIDHSAIGVADASRSIAFYEELGLSVASRSHNQGPAQASLDGVIDPDLDVVALAPAQATPHLELLCYRGQPRAHPDRPGPNDVAATRLVFCETDAPPGGRSIIDPDGHRLVMEPDPSLQR